MRFSSGLASTAIAVPRFTTGRFDIPLILAATLIAIGANLAVAYGDGIAVRGASAALGVAGIALVFASMKRLELALYAFIPLLTAVRVEPAPVDFMAVGLVGALALRGELRRFVPPRIVSIALAVFLFSYAAAMLAAQDQGGAMKYTGATLLVVAAGYVAFQLGARDIRIAERAYVLAALLMGVETIIALLPVPLADVFRYDRFRIDGLFKDPNVFGPFVAPAVALLCARWSGLHPLVRLGALALALAPVPASLARGAVVVVAVTLIVLGSVAVYRRWRSTAVYSFGLVGLGTAALVIFLLLPGSSLAKDRLSTTFQDYDSIRFGGQLAGLGWAQAHPLSFGLGPGNYDTVLGLPSHQTYLRVLVETGPLSLIAFLLLLFSAIRFIRATDPGTVAWVAGLIGFATYALLIDALHWRHLWVVLAMPLAIAAQHQVRMARSRRVEASTS